MQPAPVTQRTTQQLPAVGANAEDKKESPQEKVQATATTYICAACNKQNPAAQLCGRCKLVRYCNPTCQKSNWNVHKATCKAPLNTQVRVTTISTDGTRQTAQVPHRLWDADQMQGIVRSDTNFGSTKAAQKKLAELNISNSNCISLTSDTDVVNFAIRYSSQTISELKSQEYCGLQVTPKEVDKLLSKQNYTELLKYVWTEDSMQKRIEWLEPLANAGHAIFMLELSRALLLSLGQTHNNRVVAETYKWYALGLHCTQLDSACSLDRSTDDAATVLSSYYLPTIKLRQSVVEALSKRKIEFISSWEPKATHPSPMWIIFHGISSKVDGTKKLALEESWLERRTNEHKKILASL